MIPSISWKNIWRNHTRSLVVIFAVTLGLFGGLFGSAMMTGMSERRVEEALTKEISHIQIHNPKFLENMEPGFVIGNPDEVVSFIEKQEGVIGASKRIKINSMVNSSSANSGITLFGIEPAREKKVTDLYSALYDSSRVVEKKKITDAGKIEEFLRDSVGTYFEDSKTNPILIGEELAKKLKVKVRSKVVLTFQAMDGSIQGGVFRVCGIFRTENSSFEEFNAFVDHSDLLGLLDGGNELCHEIAILTGNQGLVNNIAGSLRNAFPDLEIRGWKEIQPDIAMMNDMMTVSTAIIMIIILLALGFGIVNTMLMVVLERTKEIGMLMAIGMSKMKVFLMIILESVLLSLTGAVIGMGISALVINHMGSRGLDLTAFVQEGFEAMGFGAVFYPSMSLENYIMVTLLVILTAILASVYPAWKALKLIPADALRTE